MPIKNSAKKAFRQSLKRRKRNISYKNKIKNLLKEIKVLLIENKPEEARKLLPQLHKALDKAAKAKVIKKNTAGRKKSRTSKLINAKSQTTNDKSSPEPK